MKGLYQEPGSPNSGLNEPSFPKHHRASGTRQSEGQSQQTDLPSAGSGGVLKCVARKGISEYFVPKTLHRQKMVSGGGQRERERKRGFSETGRELSGEAGVWGQGRPEKQSGVERRPKAPTRWSRERAAFFYSRAFHKGSGGAPQGPRTGIDAQSLPGRGVEWGGAQNPSRLGTARPTRRSPSSRTLPHPLPCPLRTLRRLPEPHRSPSPPAGPPARAPRADRAPHGLRAQPPAVRHSPAGLRRPLPPPPPPSASSGPTRSAGSATAAQPLCSRRSAAQSLGPEPGPPASRRRRGRPAGWPRRGGRGGERGGRREAR